MTKLEKVEKLLAEALALLAEAKAEPKTKVKPDDGINWSDAWNFVDTDDEEQEDDDPPSDEDDLWGTRYMDWLVATADGKSLEGGGCFQDFLRATSQEGTYADGLRRLWYAKLTLYVTTELRRDIDGELRSRFTEEIEKRLKDYRPKGGDYDPLLGYMLDNFSCGQCRCYTGDSEFVDDYACSECSCCDKCCKCSPRCACGRKVDYLCETCGMCSECCCRVDTDRRE
jgi:hypothetical protein